MLGGDAKNPIFMVARDHEAAEFLSLGLVQKSTFLAMGRQGRVCGSQQPEHRVWDHSKGGDTRKVTNLRLWAPNCSPALSPAAPSAPGTPTELSGRGVAIPHPLPRSQQAVWAAAVPPNAPPTTQARQGRGGRHPWQPLTH